MIEPAGAVITMTLSVPEPSKKAAAEPLGGRARSLAGIAVDIVVSDTSGPAVKSTLLH